jgi:hypothetical protein
MEGSAQVSPPLERYCWLKCDKTKRKNSSKAKMGIISSLKARINQTEQTRREEKKLEKSREGKESHVQGDKSSVKWW